MHAIKTFLKKYTAFFTGLLAHLGIWGPAVISTVDAAALGIPMDPVMIGYAWTARDHPLLVTFYVVTAAMGSAVGSLVPYWIGRAGGELLLLKRIDRHRLEEMRDRFEKQEAFFVGIPALLPPPTPFKLIVLSAGVFEMRVVLFLASVFISRLIRFGVMSTLVILFGPDIVRIAGDTFRHHLPLVFVILGLIVVGWFVYKRTRKRKRSTKK